MSSADLLAADAAAREQALALESFIVEAPAGAGKTELLTQRYLRLLATVNEPEEIVAITFTNKAAAEMRARILHSLESAAAGSQPGEADLPAHKRLTRRLAGEATARGAAHGWDLLRNPGRLRITTIDALSAGIARQMPLLSRFGAQPAIREDARELYQAAARNTLALLEDDSDAGRMVADALRYFDNDAQRLCRLMEAMLAKRDQWAGYVDGQAAARAESGLAALISQDLARVQAYLDADLQAGIMATARVAAGNLTDGGVTSTIVHLANWTAPLAGRLPELDAWRGLAALLLTEKGTLRKTFNVNQGLPPGKESKAFKDALAACCDGLGALDGAQAALARIQKLPRAALDDEEACIVGVFAGLLKLAAAQLWSIFQQRREVDFIEIAQRALTALGDDEQATDLQLALDYRIRHLLVDEFQDTSPAQIELLRKLTAGWMPDDGRTLFVVGDPMQSIYRFRKADVGLFLHAREHGIADIELTPLRLARNNRSHPEVVSWINRAFAQIFPRADNLQLGAVRYADSVATKQPVPEAGVFAHPVLIAQGGAGGDGDTAEARAVIDIIRAVRRQHPQASIAVLVRARSHLVTLMAEIRRSAPELCCQAVEIEALAGRQVVQDLQALTLALHHRADRLHWLAILRAPWCGLTLSDLHALAADDHRSTLWSLMNDEARVARLSADGRQRVAHLRAVCAEAFAHQGRQRPRRWIEGVWRMLGGEACLRSAAERADAAAYFRLIDALEADGGFSIERLPAEVDKLFAEPDGDAGNAVQMMTVHKSKGLEFDVVILPGLHRGTRGNDASLLLWEEFVDADGHEHLVAAPYKRKRARGERQVTAYDYLRLLDAERSDNEDERVLYVAATRAIRALHLVGVAEVENAEDGPALRQPGSGTPLAALWEAIGSDFAQALDNWEEGQGGPQHDAASFVPKLLRLARPALPASLARASGGATDGLAQSAEQEAAGGRSESDEGLSLRADIGTLAHRMLELVAQDGIARWDTARVRALEPTFSRWLEARGHPAARLAEAAAETSAMLREAISCADGRWILEARPGAANELALSDVRSGDIASHRIDRSFVDNGARWIIDYKSTRHPGQATGDVLEQWLGARAEDYRAQLERYAALFADEGRPVRMAIFFLAHARLIELPPHVA